MNTIEKKKESFEKLLDIMDELREKCPWDKKQNFESIRTLTIEETYELADAIFNKNLNEIKKELGDLLLHIVFYSKMASEQKAFDIADVIDSLNEKLIYRHPHIFGDVKVSNATEVANNWEELKLKEKGGNKSVLSGIPKSLPALVKANRIQDKARGVGFDWEDKTQIWDKVIEEFKELKKEVENNDKDKMEAEFGDLLFAVINAARLYGINPENALERTNQKFTKRFNYLEKNTIKKGLSLRDMSLDEMNEYWEKAKKYDEY
ncbi:MAG: nucleoside triphosphate pyrophosphohydrolase [Bacteroidia bacterium]|nr:MAG: nucleoside triphosphate pyrophosphohydrolase [Bacteroidia bacterium]